MYVVLAFFPLLTRKENLAGIAQQLGDNEKQLPI